MKKGNVVKTFKKCAKIATAVYGVTKVPIVKKGLTYAGKRIASKYTRTIRIYDNAQKIRVVLDEIKKINPDITRYYNCRGAETPISNTTFILPVGNKTFAKITAGLGVDGLGEDTNVWALEVIIFGKEFEKVYDQITADYRATEASVLQFNVSGDPNDDDFRAHMSKITERELDTLFYDDGVVEKIVSDIDKFLSRRELYSKRGVTYKMGLMFSGEPGTGKSSLARVLATKYKADLVSVQMSDLDHINLIALGKSLMANPNGSMYIVLLEDIDTYSIDREDKSEENVKNKKKTMSNTDRLNKLLQFLDGPDSPSNVIIIATTNHPDRLDRALIRRGRIDHHYVVSSIMKDTAIKMCGKFGMSNADAEVMLKDSVFPINQGDLQGMILDTLNDGDDPDESLDLAEEIKFDNLQPDESVEVCESEDSSSMNDNNSFDKETEMILRELVSELNNAKSKDDIFDAYLTYRWATTGSTPSFAEDCDDSDEGEEELDENEESDSDEKEYDND